MISVHVSEATSRVERTRRGIAILDLQEYPVHAALSGRPGQGHGHRGAQAATPVVSGDAGTLIPAHTSITTGMIMGRRR